MYYYITRMLTIQQLDIIINSLMIVDIVMLIAIAVLIVKSIKNVNK